MIKITNEINGKKYELVPRGDERDCSGCSFEITTGKYNCSLPLKESLFNDIFVCAHLEGIWKEVRDAD
jgi:hypothetical protein